MPLIARSIAATICGGYGFPNACSGDGYNVISSRRASTSEGIGTLALSKEHSVGYRDSVLTKSVRQESNGTIGKISCAKNYTQSKVSFEATTGLLEKSCST